MLSFLSKKKFLIGILLLFLVLASFGLTNFNFGQASPPPPQLPPITKELDNCIRTKCAETAKESKLAYWKCIGDCMKLHPYEYLPTTTEEALIQELKKLELFQKIEYWVKSIVLILFSLPAIVIGVVIGISVTASIIIIDFLAYYFFGQIVKLIVEGEFIQLAYTNPEYNPIIKVGLDITLPFANMFFILILVVIAIATILRIETYALKRTLFPLIIIALLINFLPLFCGLVVDFANLIMRFFLANPDYPITGWNAFADKIKETWGEGGFLELLKRPTDLDFDFDRELRLRYNMAVLLLLKGIALIIVGILNIVTLGIYAFLLMLRYIMIWNFVIIGPVALACYILPATKKYFDWWLKQFFEWAFVGVMAGFFIFLGNAINVSIRDVGEIIVFPTPPSIISESPHSVFTYVLALLLPYAIAPIFMLKGLFEGFKTSAMFGDTIIRRGGQTFRWLGREWILNPLRGRFSRRREGEGEGRERRGRRGRREWGFGSTIIPLIGGKPVGMKEALDFSARKKIKDAEKRAENLSKEGILRQVKEREVKGYDAVGSLIALNAQEGGANYLYEELRGDPKFQERFSELYTIAQRVGRGRGMLKDPRSAEFVQDKEPFKEITGPGKTGKTIMEATKSIKPDDVKLWSKEPLQSKAVVEVIAQRGENEVLRVLDRDQTESFNTTLSKIIKRDVRMGRRAGFSEPDIRANISTKFGNYDKAVGEDRLLQAKGFARVSSLIDQVIRTGGTGGGDATGVGGAGGEPTTGGGPSLEERTERVRKAFKYKSLWGRH